MCFGCSKELSHWDGSFEYPEHMFWLRNKKNNFLLHTLIWGPAHMYIYLYSLQIYDSISDSFTILGVWVLGLAVSNINESPLQTNESKTLFLMTSLLYYCIPGLAGTRWNKNLCAKDAGCAGNIFFFVNPFLYEYSCLVPPTMSNYINKLSWWCIEQRYQMYHISILKQTEQSRPNKAALIRSTWSGSALFAKALKGISMR